MSGEWRPVEVRYDSIRGEWGVLLRGTLLETFAPDRYDLAEAYAEGVRDCLRVG